MKQYFTSLKQEKLQYWLMLIAYSIFGITVWIMLYSVLNHANYIQALLPVLFFSLGCYYLVRGWNGFTKETSL